ncbi:MAG: tyrosine--tRNA ligase [Chloroflexota bacterium]|nr:tyrosine--tRNA ligase [Dehalococcoidia bacterium]MDW8255067.1 tyrosine--tRNA ligase [Chloroflexota bacterium]
MSDVLDLLRERGFVKEISNEAGLRAALQRPITVYNGIDPTAPSMHVGHLIGMMALAHLQRAGHRPIVIVGGGTALVGDPSGRTSARQLLSKETVDANLVALQRQVARFLDFAEGRALMLNNAEWLLKLGYIEFLRDIGRHFTVGQILQHETYRERLAGEGLSVIEFNYVLLQAYDFLHLFREYGCLLQVGGSDQWFNILAGVDLIRRETGQEAFGLVWPLLLKADGTKMGKTASGAIWLSAELTSPYDFYQYWINCDDADVGRLLRLFTFLPLDEIERLEALRDAEIRHAKEVLAYELTALVHGTAAADQARTAARALFGGEGDLAAAPTVTIPAAALAAGVTASHLFVLAFGDTRAAIKRLIEQGGASINGERVAGDPKVDTSWLRDGALLLRKGKKQYKRVVPV